MKKINLKTVSNAIAVYHLDPYNYKKRWMEQLWNEEEKLPSGSGIDKGCRFILDDSKPNKIVIDIPYHHMDENGFYCGWNTYQVTLKPCFRTGIDIKIKCTIKGADVKRWDRELVIDYLYDLFAELFV